MNRGKLGILVGGGPAPGINSAISAVTIEARNEGVEVFGIYDGFEHLIAGRTDMIRPLQIADVSRIHSQGGSILRTSRANPTKPEVMAGVIELLKSLDISYLVTIGGDDTAFAAATISRQAAGALRVAHIPKTIDNDLPLPANMATFGYETARQLGTELVLTIMEDSRTSNRWFVVVVMGRKAGHLALGIGKAAGATVTIIPEEFPRPQIEIADVSRIIEGAIIKRRSLGQNHGVAVVAEGVAEKIDPEELKRQSGMSLSHDPYGHISLADIPIGTLIKQSVQRRFAERGAEMRLTEVSLGYELRCTQPIPFDIDYTRTLGYGAVKFILGDGVSDAGHGGFVYLDGTQLRVIPFEDLADPATGRTRVRLVDIDSVHYSVARDYMIRIEPEDLADPVKSARLAESAGMTEADFRAEYSRLFPA
jgi:6-phosphofructokinase 1